MARPRSIYAEAFREGVLTGLVTVACLAGFFVVAAPLVAVIFAAVRILQ